MVKTCENCGCPLGQADLDAAQCPVCRKTVWRFVGDEPTGGETEPREPERETPLYQGTMLPPSFSGTEDEEFVDEEFVDDELPGNAGQPVPNDAGAAGTALPSSADHSTDHSSEPPGDPDRTNAATLDTVDDGNRSTLVPPAQESAAKPPVTEPSAPERPSDRSEADEPGQRATVTMPAGDPNEAATLVIGAAQFDSDDLDSDDRSGPHRHGGTLATVDPRNFDGTDWEQWEQRLRASLSGEAAGPAGKPATTRGASAATADLQPPKTSTKAGPKDSRYVGKTSVASRLLVRPDESVPPSHADYALGDALGAGGMGIVYEATQRSINRSVAIKMLKAETARRRDRRDSLATEAIVTGELTHPNIVPIHDLGQDAAGNLFYSMKRVEGERWDEALSRRSESENLEIFLKVADAIAFAHSRGVVHRDLKPENVLLGGFGEVLVMDWGLAYATERFGKHDSITANLAMGGSPAYMAPEQATAFLISGGWRAGKLPEITTAIDVYLLGAILFEIATGQPPHSGNDPALCVVAAAENQIREVNSGSGLLPIALRAMETDPADRFASVEELQSAVREYTRNAESVALAERAESVMQSGDLARAVVGFEDALELWPENPHASAQVVIARRRLTRRRYALTAMTAAFLLAIVLGGLGINHQREKAVVAQAEAEKANVELLDSIAKEQQAATEAKRSAMLAKKVRVLAQIDERRAEKAARQEKRASEAAENARQVAVDARMLAEDAQALAELEQERQRYQNYQGRIKLIDARIEENAFAEAERLLTQLAEESPDLCGWEWGRLKYLCSQARRSLDTDAPVTASAVTADGSLLVTGDADGRLRTWSFGEYAAVAAEADRLLPDLGFDRVTALAVSPDGRLIAAAGTGSSDVVLIPPHRPQATPVRLSTSSSPVSAAVSLGFSADGSRLLSAGESGLIVWNTETGQPIERSRVARTGRGRLPITCAAISPDGTTVVAGLADGQILLWSSRETGSLFDEARVFDGHRAQTEFADGFQYLAGHVTSLAVLPDGATVVSGDEAGRLLHWNTRLATPRNDERDLADAFASAVAATRGSDPTAADGPQRTGITEATAHDGAVSTISVRTDESGDAVVVTGGDDGLIKVWRNVADWPNRASVPQPQAVLRGHEGRIASVAGFEAPGSPLNVFSAGVDATNRLWDVARYQEVRDVGPKILADHQQEILSARFSPDGRRLLTAGRDEKLVLTDLEDPTAEPFQSIKVHGEAISVPWIVPFADGARLATGYFDGSFAIWSIADRTTLARVTPQVGSSLIPPAVSHDGRWIAASYRRSPDDRSIAVWSVERLIEPEATTPAPDFVFEPRGEIFAATFTTDGRLVFGDRSGPDRPAGGFVYVADLESGELATHRVFGDGVEGRVYALASLPGGDVLAAGSPSVGNPVQVVVLDTSTGNAAGAALSLAGTFLPAMTVSQDGRRLATLTNVGGDRSQSLELWSLERNERVWDVTLTDARITAIDLSPDGETLLAVTEPVRRQGNAIVATGPSEVRLLDAETGDEQQFGRQNDQPLLTGAEIGSRISGGAWSTDGTTLFLAAIRGVTEWSVSNRTRRPGVFDSHGAISATGFSHDGHWIVDGHRDGSFEIRDANTPRLTPMLHRPPVGSRGTVTAAEFSPHAGSLQFLIATNHSLTLREFDPARKSAPVVREFAAESPGQSLGVRDVTFSEDNRWIAAACDDGAARIWSVDDGEPMVVLRRNTQDGASSPGHVGPVTAVAFPSVPVREGFQLVATGGEDRSILVWLIDARTGEVATTVPFRGHRGPITDLAFLPGRFDALVSASGDGTAKLWDWDRGGLRSWNEEEFVRLGEPDEVLTLGGRHTAGLTAVDVSQDGLTIVTAGRDGRAILWPSTVPPQTSH